MNDKNEVLIQVQDLKKAFGKLEVLRGISTEIKKGEVVVVIGPSGSGKSTFFAVSESVGGSNRRNCFI